MNVTVFKFKISLRHCDCDYWSRAKKKTATALQLSQFSLLRNGNNLLHSAATINVSIFRDHISIYVTKSQAATTLSIRKLFVCNLFYSLYFCLDTCLCHFSFFVISSALTFLSCSCCSLLKSFFFSSLLTNSLHWPKESFLSLHHITLTQGYTYFPKIYEPPQNSEYNKNDQKLVTCWGYTNIRPHGTKFSRPGFV